MSKHQWGGDGSGAELLPLFSDASFRQYFRLVHADKTAGGKTAMLMDAPPEHENIQPFLNVTDHLQRLGLRVPQIFSHDTRNGFIILEDLGTETFTALLNAGRQALPLYKKAITALAQLHSSPNAININVGHYDFERLIDEACLFTKWYLPAVIGESGEPRAGNQQRQAHYIAAWKTIYNNLPNIESTLVLRDYHADNLMLVDNQCALLDYQDAVIGSPAYDVVSLLEDARRDIDANLYVQILETYFNQRPKINRQAFNHHCMVWGAQRHCKVAGIFMRLWLRDNKPRYLGHLARVLGLLRNKLDNPALAPLCAWFAQNAISLHYRKPQASREQILSQIHA